MKIKNNDFIELDFTAKTEEGKVFDTTIAEEAKKANLPESDYKPVTLCVGQAHLFKRIDKALVGKEIGQEFTIELLPEEAFGKRMPDLVKIIPLKIFMEKEVNPYPGMPVAIDNTVATVRAVSGGRVITDFNHPLAGRKVIYKIKLRKKLEKPEEKIKVIIEKYFKTDKFSLDDKKILIEENYHEILAKEVEKKIHELVGDFTIGKKEQGKSGKPAESQASAEKKKV